MVAFLAELPSIRKMHWGYQEGWQQFPKQSFERLKKNKLKIIANNTHKHTQYSHLLAQKCWQLLQGAEKIIIILQAA